MFELFDPSADVRIRDGSSLPHWFQPKASYFVTFRTEDSIPVDVQRDWHVRRAMWLSQYGLSPNDPNWPERLSQLPEQVSRAFHESFSREYLASLDKGHGACVLRHPDVSEIVSNSLLHFDRQRYHMGDFVVITT